MSISGFFVILIVIFEVSIPQFFFRFSDLVRCFCFGADNYGLGFCHRSKRLDMALIFAGPVLCNRTGTVSKLLWTPYTIPLIISLTIYQNPQSLYNYWLSLLCCDWLQLLAAVQLYIGNRLKLFISIPEHFSGSSKLSHKHFYCL